MNLKEKLEEIQLKIKESDMVLVGIGSELDTEKNIDERKQQFSRKILEKDQIENFINPDRINYKEFYKRCFSVYEKTNGSGKKNKALYHLADMLYGKNYFVISTNVDECLYQSGFKEGYLVTPCGRETMFQCRENCNDLVWENSTYLQELFLNQRKNGAVFDIAQNKEQGLLEEEQEQFMPKCPNCGKIADFNIIRSERQKMYCQKGYLKDWERYMKWLSGILNKKLLLLDLGTDFLYPHLIRWAFERTALLNQKSYLIRVHENLSNVPKELKERAESIAVNSRTLLEL